MNTASSYDNIHTIRYMGNKAKLLPFIVPVIEDIVAPGGTVCDLCAGTNSIGYALKRRNRIIANDIQTYSTVIARALLLNQDWRLSAQDCLRDLQAPYERNMAEGEYDLIASLYSDKYFAPEQCRQIDSLRFAIEQVENEDLRALYLTNLMGAMCVAQSSPGHFAQFLDKSHPRVKSLRGIDVWETFLSLSSDYDAVVFSDFVNEAYTMECCDLLDLPAMREVDCFYLDSPYSQEQYSRFYHVLETICKYDYPETTCKAGYRTDRYMSDFCYKSKAADAFASIFEKTAAMGKPAVVSYSTKGVVPSDELEAICRAYYGNIVVLSESYKHSTQGKGSVGISELLYVLRQPRC